MATKKSITKKKSVRKGKTNKHWTEYLAVFQPCFEGEQFAAQYKDHHRGLADLQGR